MNIGSKLRYLIEEANITQRQLADALHISPSALNGYINQGKEPDYATLVRIADYFHTSTDYLLGHSNICLLYTSHSIVLVLFIFLCLCKLCCHIIQFSLLIRKFPFQNI